MQCPHRIAQAMVMTIQEEVDAPSGDETDSLSSTSSHSVPRDIDNLRQYYAETMLAVDNITWRILNEDPLFICDIPTDKYNARFGYFCEVEVMLHGHTNCNCRRQHSTETMVLYLPQPREVQVFPVFWSTIEGKSGWLSQINSNSKFGNNEGSIGWIVKKPTRYMFGWLWRDNLSFHKLVTGIRSRARNEDWTTELLNGAVSSF